MQKIFLSMHTCVFAFYTCFMLQHAAHSFPSTNQFTVLQFFGFCLKHPLLTRNNEGVIRLQHPRMKKLDPADKNLQLMYACHGPVC